MKTYTKNYIGKGIQNEKLNLVKVTLKVEELLKYKHEFNGEEYISFEVAKMQAPDQFGRTHTAYVTVMEETVETEKPKKIKKIKPNVDFETDKNGEIIPDMVPQEELPF